MLDILIHLPGSNKMKIEQGESFSLKKRGCKNPQYLRVLYSFSVSL